ncbi:hypothetical protein GLYMA_06G315433v4 [Glycine max]|nr:hypothetical protein GLYMA_06G315433v4 [Glycine max]KAH1101163.1 hypothetical protein GYH30_035986 [Glycine max]
MRDNHHQPRHRTPSLARSAPPHMEDGWWCWGNNLMMKSGGGVRSTFGSVIVYFPPTQWQLPPPVLALQSYGGVRSGALTMYRRSTTLSIPMQVSNLKSQPSLVSTHSTFGLLRLGI